MRRRFVEAKLRRHGRCRLFALIAGAVVVLSACGGSTAGTGEAQARAAVEVERCTAVAAPGERVESASRTEDPSALRDINHNAFPAPLVDTSEIRSGGPPPDGIPPIDDPLFLPVCAIDFLEENEPVAVLTLGDETRVYPIQILTWHEIVNDVVDGIPVSITYCPLCNSTVAFDRRVEGSVLDFGTSGSLYQSNLVMYDRQSESLWAQFTGEAIVGAKTGTQLEILPMSIVSWSDVLVAKPDALVLSTETGFDRNYGRNPYPGYDDASTSPFLFDGEVDDRLAAKTRILGIRRNGEAVAIVRSALVEAQVMDIEVGGEAVVVFAQVGTTSALDAAEIADGRDVGSAGAFLPLIDGQTLTFSASADGFVDAETGSIWNILGEATSGELIGTQLSKVDHDDSFWFAWGAFEPASTILR